MLRREHNATNKESPHASTNVRYRASGIFFISWPGTCSNGLQAAHQRRPGRHGAGWSGPNDHRQCHPRSELQFARSYASRLCPASQITASNVVPDATRQLTAKAVEYGRAQGAPAQAWVGEET